jgi:hypothetical protein
MSSTISRTSRRITPRSARPTRRVQRNGGDQNPASDSVHPKREHMLIRKGRTLDRYTDCEGRAREVIARPGAGGSVLVLDQSAGKRGRCSLLAHIAPDEPTGNAAVVCRRFVAQARRERLRCRALSAEDLRTVPFSEGSEVNEARNDSCGEAAQFDSLGRCYRLELLSTGMSIPELRWCCRPRPEGGESRPVSLREAIAALESYEPVSTLTRHAVVLHEREGDASVTVLRAELRRMQESPIVLNRGLRAAVLDAVERRGSSMSEIAMRCGRVKRDAAGNESGETSWLARRLGLLPEGGRKVATPWIHSDVLALIARDGLGLSPREVEVE